MTKIIFLFLFLIKSLCYSQQSKIDSLLSLVKNDVDDTSKVLHLNSICFEYILQGEYYKGLPYAKQGLELSKKINFDKGISRTSGSLGLIFANQGNYSEALNSQLTALQIREKMNDRSGIAASYLNIGHIYRSLHDFTKALENYQASLSIYRRLNDKLRVADVYMCLGNTYYELHENNDAMTNYFIALKMYEEIKYTLGVRNINTNIANVYRALGNHAEALKIRLTLLKQDEELGNKESLSIDYLSIGQLYIDIHNLKEAESFINKALLLGKETGYKEVLKESYYGLFQIDSLKADYKKALINFQLYSGYKDSLLNELTQRNTFKASMQYEFDKKEIASKLEQDKLNAINEERNIKQQMIIYFVVGLFLVVLVFSIFIYKRFRITNNQKLVIEEQKLLVDSAYQSLHEKNKEVIDSIHYAQKIQRALITSEKYIENKLNQLNKK